ncbi:hypothetical protein MKX01_006738 [Papaver californicum]|nr:hypothetical protein MKX01_006738 [Papaver californicum]
MGVFSSLTGELRQRFDNKVLADCRETSNEEIGVWDQVTGKQTDFFDLRLGGDHARKVQWLNESNCLFVGGFINNKYHMDLLDFRDKSLPHIWDAIPMAESNSICVVSHIGTLGFLDLRSTKGGVRWHKNLGDFKAGYYPKLTFHGGQIFCSMNDEISIYCDGGSIRDFSIIGDDRLFALHSEENCVLRVGDSICPI